MFCLSSFRSRRRTWALVFAVTFALGAFGSPNKHQAHNNASKAQHKVNRKDPAFVAGYDEGYRQGANDSHALANYNDQGGPAYVQATEGYTAQYGDKEVYQQRFRLGYIEGYKAGWDFNAGMYNPLGAGSW
jgi:hypothetical protein